ncbi:YbhB/YbcL family Raf kinase inhibitor-like protein [Haloferacaceae archaeon DSL9]
MVSRRRVLGALAAVATGTRFDPVGTQATDAASGLRIDSPAFATDEPIPEQYTCDGANVSPPIAVSDAPRRAASLALVFDDPDAPTADPFVHWLVWDISVDAAEIPAGIPPSETVAALDGAGQGTNSAGELGYTGPCPPADDPPHTYRLTVYALDATLGLDAGSERDAFERLLAEHRLDGTTLTATYGR